MTTETNDVADATEQADKIEQQAHVTTKQRVLRQILADPLAMVGGSVIALVFAVAIFSAVDQFLLERRLITALLNDPYATNREARLLGPSVEYPMGTDHQGRDVMARVIYGTRTSIFVGVTAVTTAAVFGILIGAVTAYYGNLTDMIGMRAMDVLLAFPAILLAIGLLAVFGRGITNVIIAITIVYTPIFARVARSEFLSEKSEEYVDAARVIGYPDRRIMIRELLPNCLTSITVQFTFSLALAIIAEASLSFLGVGVSPITPSWGMMLSQARDYMTIAWWFSLFPGVSIAITVFSFNILGDSLRDALDPEEGSGGGGMI
ncbi:ABC transporter permease [Natronolimnobius baerhuensis]|uniref:ABC transporter permease n=1 Tax=Natronolimnobius baerhuensis TaxID=253108 RepID=UPI000B3F8A46|nr:ABC transporter permease [Natronolimnobius baerhuensis]